MTMGTNTASAEAPLGTHRKNIHPEASAENARPRHRLSTRLWHWINFSCLVILFMSGLNISNAHPWLYWGDAGFLPEEAWLSVMRFPGWATIPDYYSLAAARDWHLSTAWLYAIGLLFIWISMLANRHFRRDIAIRRREWHWSAIKEDVRNHLRFKFDPEEGKYNFFQKLSYGLVYVILLPLMIFTGMAISPGWEPTLSWMIDLMGGRQSARSLHFLIAWALFAFFVLHVALVFVSGPIGQMKAMFLGDRK